MNEIPEDPDQLIEAVWPDAYRLAYAVLGERGAAEDAAQEACIIVYRSISSLRSREAFKVWLYRIVVREATEIKRRRSRTLAVEREPSYSWDRSDALDLWRALDALPPALRTVIVLHYFEDLTSAEIASVLRIPSATVRFRLVLARRRLRPLLELHTAPTHEVPNVV